MNKWSSNKSTTQTFDQQRHEGNDGRFQLGNRQSVRPVVPGRVLWERSHCSPALDQLTARGMLDGQLKDGDALKCKIICFNLPSSFQIPRRISWICWEVSVKTEETKVELVGRTGIIFKQTGTHLPGLTQPAHCWVTQSHDDSKEGVQVPVLFATSTENVKRCTLEVRTNKTTSSSPNEKQSRHSPLTEQQSWWTSWEAAPSCWAGSTDTSLWSPRTGFR